MAGQPQHTGLRPLTDANGNPVSPQVVMMASPPPPKSRGFLSKLLGGLVLSLLLMSILANVYLAGIVGLLTAGNYEVTYQLGNPKERILILPIEGIITSDTESYVAQSLRYIEANKDDMPRAIILRVDSPGGSVGPSDRILNHIERFQKRHPSIPIVASYGSVAASGGYYVSATCDQIFAEPTCITGSIGVIIQAMTFGELMTKLGIEPVVLVADGSPKKDVANNPFRTLNEQDQAKLKAILNNAYDQFLAVVTRGRSKVLSADEIKALANGDTYSTQQAIANKLIDGQGYLEDVIEETKKLAKLSSDAQVTWMKSPQSFSLIDLISGKSEQQLPQSGEQLRDWVRTATQPTMEYLWLPGM